MNAMMKPILLFALLAGSLTGGQAKSPELTADIQAQLAHFSDSDWRHRSEAFYELTRTGCPACTNSQHPVLGGLENVVNSGSLTKDELAKHLIDLLATESAFRVTHFTAVGSAPEGYFDYVGDLAMSVVDMRDKRSVDALIGFIDTGGMVGSGIAKLGDPALTKVLAIATKTSAPLEGGESERVTGDYYVLARMTEPKNLQNFEDPAKARSTIKHQLTVGVYALNPFVRANAIRGLAQMGDSDALPVIRQALKDPYSMRNGESLIYPVRQAAQAALDKIQAANLHK